MYRYSRLVNHLSSARGNTRSLHACSPKTRPSIALVNPSTSTTFTSTKNSRHHHCAPSASYSPNESVLVQDVATAGKLVTLNRPKALNALNQDMVNALIPIYQRWSDDKKEAVIVMKGEGEKAFCAGGDIVAIYRDKMAGKSVEEVTEFFRTEYILNQLIGNLPSHTAQISLYNGIVMGGGVGLSVHAKYRVATENTLFAMPEVGIGLFPDVGGSHFLPRLKHNLGMYLALTGERLRGADVLHAGVATHYVPHEKFSKLEHDLLNSTNVDQVPEILDTYADQPESLPNKIEPHLSKIDEIFGLNSVDEVLAALEQDGSEWAEKCRKMMLRASPTSVKVTFRELKEGARLEFADCFKMEHRMTREIARQGDFFEGVRALMVDKDNRPKWSPAKLSDVSDEMVDKYFQE